MSNEKENTTEQILQTKVGELVRIAKAYLAGEWTMEQMNEYGQNMTIRTYIPLLDKMSLVMSILTTYMYTGTSTQEIKIAELYKNIFFHVVLEQYGMIDCSDEKYTTYETYDLLYPLFGVFILGYCQKDYDQFMEYIRDTINVYGIESMVEATENITPEAIKEANKETKDLVRAFEKNKELIEQLNNISIMNDPTSAELLQGVKKAAIVKAVQDMEEEENKIEK